VAFWILSLAALFNVNFIVLSVVMLNLVMLNAVAGVTDLHYHRINYGHKTNSTDEKSFIALVPRSAPVGGAQGRLDPAVVASRHRPWKLVHRGSDLRTRVELLKWGYSETLLRDLGQWYKTFYGRDLRIFVIS
jgi:hypothetical protein